jgi:hypothetical protein
MANLAVGLSEAGEYVAAERLERELIAVKSRLLGPQHPDTLNAMEYLAGRFITRAAPRRRRS